MKIDLVSDLHLEFHPYTIENRNGAELLILAGDICQVGNLSLTFFERCSDQYENVVYVMGNHEFYQSSWPAGVDQTRMMLSHLPNVHVLEKSTLDIGDFTIVGGTLWTDMGREDPLTIHAVEGMMNDFRMILHSEREIRYDDDSGRPRRADRFRVQDALADHYQMMAYTRHVVTDRPGRRYIWAVHYGVSHQSIHEKYAAYSATNGGFVSDLDEFILDHPQIELVVHGHTHSAFSYKIGDTRIECNPRGYPRENPGPYLPKTIILP